MKRRKPDSGTKSEAETQIPALFATIRFQSDERPDGYTDDDIQTLNEIANTPKPRSPE